MLQKYHPNPLSHFLALHNSQPTHNHVATTIANSHSQFHQPAILHHHHPQQQQQHNLHHLQHLNQPQQQQHHQTAAALLAANQQQQQHHNSHSIPHLVEAAAPTNSSHHHHNHSSLRHHSHPTRHSHTQQLIEAAAAVNTTLDAGKSFTIAAILGLQKSAMESSCKEYTNNVINLSLNGGSNGNTEDGNVQQNSNLATPEPRATDEHSQHPQQQQQHHHNHHLQQRLDSLSAHNNNNNNNNNNSRDVTNFNVANKSSSLSSSSNICNSFHSTANNIINAAMSNSNLSSSASSVNSFNCDNVTVAVSGTAGGVAQQLAAASVLMNRYLPSAMVNVTGAAGTPVMAHQQHSRANSFVAAAAAAPSALQSLQQLHQQHAAAHQNTLSFQREKLKSENNAKKSSLKNKRVRTIFTPEQLERLEAEFERQQYMVGPERLYLAHTLQLTEAQVKVWFQNRRIKWRKHHLEMTQQRLALLRQTQIVPDNTEQAPVKIDGTDDEDCDNIKREELRDLNDSRQDTESELSVCNDSMDAESIIDDEEET